MPKYQIAQPAFVAGTYHGAGEIIDAETETPAQDWVPYDDDAKAKAITRRHRSNRPRTLPNGIQTIAAGSDRKTFPQIDDWIDGKPIFQPEQKS